MRRGRRKDDDVGGGEQGERDYDYVEVMACPSGCVNGGGQIPPSTKPARSRRRDDVDEEGMPRFVDEDEVKLVAPVRSGEERDGERVLTAKEWVERVEAAYWADRPAKRRRGPSAKAASREVSQVHPSISPFVLASRDQDQVDDFTARIMSSILQDAATDEEREARRREVFRTSYRAVQQEEVNGLAVNW